MLQTNPERILKGATSCECDLDIRLNEKVSDKYALVDVFLSLIGSPGDRVVPLQQGNVAQLSVVKVNGQMRNSLLGSAVWDP